MLHVAPVSTLASNPLPCMFKMIMQNLVDYFLIRTSTNHVSNLVLVPLGVTVLVVSFLLCVSPAFVFPAFLQASTAWVSLLQ